eukprot:g70859.t1
MLGLSVHEALSVWSAPSAEGADMHRKDFRSGPWRARPGRRREGSTRHMVDAFCSSLVKLFLCVCVCAEGIFRIRQFGDLKSEPVVGAPQPEQKVQLQQAEAKKELKEAEAKLKEAEAKLKEAKNEPKEAEAKLKEAEAKLKEAEAKLKYAKATGTDEDVGLARRQMEIALDSQQGVASSQKGIASAQELVDACIKRVAFFLKQPAAGPVALSFPLYYSQVGSYCSACDFRVFVPFEFPKSLDELFPRHGIGKQLFLRGTFVAGAVKSILESRLPHYWRGAPGSGKTVFLKLLGRELQAYGKVLWCDSAGFLDNYRDNSFFSALAAEGAVFLLVDEVQDSPNSPHWVYLLKNHPKNLITIGVGITNLQHLSAPFPKKFPDRGEPPPMSVSEQDLSDVTEFWCRQSPHVPIKLVSDICDWLFRYTGGHFFPFLKFTEAVFSETVVDLIDLHSVAKYVLSQEFSQSAAYIAVKEGCFNTLSEDVWRCSQRIIWGLQDPRDYGKLEKVGYWDAGLDWFISDLFTAQVFRNRKVYEARDDEFTINENAPLDDNLRILITAGLQDMQRMDFEQPTSFNHRYENGLAFIWGWHLSRIIPSLFISPQTQALPTIRGKKLPEVDFYFDGRLDVAVELARNMSASDLAHKFDKFQKSQQLPGKKMGGPGPYACWPNYAILHFQMPDKDPVMPASPYDTEDFQSKLYTFQLPRNSLFRGRTLIQSGVVKALPTPPSHRSFSSLVFRSTRHRTVVSWLPEVAVD